MSYRSESPLPKETKLNDVIEFVQILGYEKISGYEYKRIHFLEFEYFEKTDYQSFSGIQLTICKNEKQEATVLTSTPFGRSYHDLTYQNFTIRQIQKRFGGSFITDYGRGRYFRPKGRPAVPQASGCYLAFQRFGNGLIRADLYLKFRSFAEPWNNPKAVKMDEHNPVALSNNLLLPYLVSIMEDYFRSTFVALLKYSERKESFLKNTRIFPDYLIEISSGKLSVEEGLSQTLSFQNIVSICQHFKFLEPKLDLNVALRKPYHHRKQSLFESLEDLTARRHGFVHKGKVNRNFGTKDVLKAVDDLEESVTRCYRAITNYYGWAFHKLWSRSRKHQANPPKS